MKLEELSDEDRAAHAAAQQAASVVHAAVAAERAARKQTFDDALKPVAGNVNTVVELRNELNVLKAFLKANLKVV